MPAHGPWTQPADAWQTVPADGNVQYDNISNAATQPDPSSTGPGTPGPGNNSIDARYDVRGVLVSGELVSWTWDQRVEAVAIDLTPIVDGGGLQPVPPASSLLALPHVIGFEYENPAGAALGPVKVLIHSTGVEGRNLDDSSKTLDPTVEIMQSRIRLARLPSGDYTVDTGTHNVLLTPDDYPSRSYLASLSPFLDTPAARTSADLILSDDPPGGGLHDNLLSSDYTAAAVEIDTTLSALDGARRFAFLGWIDRIQTGVAPTLETDGFYQVIPAYTAEGFLFSGDGALNIQVNYRPPRWRLLYDVLPRLRQFPRNDALGGAPRQGRVNGSTSRQGSARQGWTNTYR